jgi:SAM-dependent methyltransferase
MNKNIEDVKNFWNSRPCNVNHSKKPFYTKEYFDEVEYKKFLVEPHTLEFTNFPEWKGKNVLEIGCGIGTAAVNFSKNGANYTGVELSDISLDITKKRFSVYDLPGEFYCGNSEKLNEFLPKKTYDLVYSFGVIHHSPNPNLIINQIKNYINKNSVLKIMLYATNSWKKIMIDANLDQYEAQSGCPIANTYTYEDVENLLEGFDIIDFSQTHIFPYKIEEYKKNIYKKQDWFEFMPDEMFRALESKLGWHLLITAKLK